MRKDDGLLGPITNPSYLDGRELPPEIIQTCERVIENDDCFTEVRVGIALRQKQRKRQNRLVSGAECVSEVRRTDYIPACSG